MCGNFRERLSKSVCQGLRNTCSRPCYNKGQVTISQDCRLPGHSVTQDRAGQMLFWVLEELTQISQEAEMLPPGECYHPADPKTRPFYLALYVYKGLYLHHLI